MTIPSIRDILDESIEKTVSDIDQYVERPGKDFTRTRKLPAQTVISYLIAQGTSPLRDGMMDFFGASLEVASVQALCQQRLKLKPEAIRRTFQEVTSAAYSHIPSEPYQYLAADGSTFTYTSDESHSGEEYHTGQGGEDGSYSVHLNAMYDIKTGLYTDGVIQPVRKKDEYKAFCTMADRHHTQEGSKAIFIGDRGYCSYNNMAHVIEADQFFLFRSKDVDSKGLLLSLGLPTDMPVDTCVTYTLVRTQAKKVLSKLDGNIRYVNAATAFDYIEHGSKDAYRLTFRIVRFLLDSGSWECIVTNLPQDEFPPERIKEIYAMRWGIETSFRKLKYTLGTLSFHSYIPKLVMQEIWAGLTAYNLTSLAITAAPVEQKNGRKYTYIVNFSAAAHVVRLYLRACASLDEKKMLSMISKMLLPVRPNRKFERSKTAHFRRPKYILYRPA